MKKSFADILKGISENVSRKVAAKLPEWAEYEGLDYPSGLCLEQCSSSAAARYKAGIAERTLNGKSACVVDLTSGLGVDCWAFSSFASKVIGYEADARLAAASTSNFARMGIRNIEIRNLKVDSSTEIPQCDIIYADPARRDLAGKKVFLLEDCSPNILELLPGIFAKAPVFLLKLSPMADISMLASRLGSSLKEVHVVSLKGEVKELLCLMEKDWSGEYLICVKELSEEGDFRFKPSEETAAKAILSAEPKVGDLLWEPSAAMLKSGAFKLPCMRLGAKKLAPMTHLYLCASPLPLGRNYRIVETIPAGNAGFKDCGRKYPLADVSARNIPMNSEQLRTRLGVREGDGGTHIFGCSTSARKILIVTRKI